MLNIIPLINLYFCFYQALRETMCDSYIIITFFVLFVTFSIFLIHFITIVVSKHIVRSQAYPFSYFYSIDLYVQGIEGMLTLWYNRLAKVI